MDADEARVSRYMKAFRWRLDDTIPLDTIPVSRFIQRQLVRAVIAVADEEQAELRAEIERLHERLAASEKSFMECFERWKKREKERDQARAELADASEA